ncbi:sortase, partial [Streptococcus gallolyticus]
TYEVDQILTVLPNDMSAVAIDPEQDYVTLVTCTPYGVNTHRLLVRGHRIPNKENAVRITTEASLENNLLLIVVAVIIAIILLIIIGIYHKLRHR